MSESTIKCPFYSEILLDSVVDLSQSQEITLPKGADSFRELVIDFNTNSGNPGSTRGIVILPCGGRRNISAHHYTLSCGGAIGYVRLEMTGKILTFISSSLTPLYIGQIVGIF